MIGRMLVWFIKRYNVRFYFVPACDVDRYETIGFKLKLKSGRQYGYLLKIPAAQRGTT